MVLSDGLKKNKLIQSHKSIMYLMMFLFGCTGTSKFSEYKWDNLKIGGGGYVTGIAIHPSDKEIMYIRTDVGGAYRWDKEDGRWYQMLGWVSPENANLIGVDGIALDPNNTDRIYLALGQRIDEDGGVYRSDDSGETWKELFNVTFEGNGRNARWIGECIAVDPLNSEIIYVGTRRSGLWRSIDDGNTWDKIQDVPAGYTGIRPTGVRTIVFDPSKSIKGKSSTVYIGVPNSGIYFSSDGGETFAQMEGAPNSPARMQVVNSELFVTHDRGVAFFSNGKWLDVTPEQNKNYVALTVDETDSKKLVVAQRYGRFYNPIYRSRDKGASWEQINTVEVPAILNVTVPWWSKTRFSSATAGMAVAPGGSGELYYTDWFGVWQTPDVWADVTEWNTIIDGHEETVVLSLVSPPSGPLLYSGVADVSGFIHTNTTHFTDQKISDYNECFSITVCEKQPAHVALLGAKSWGGDETTLQVSDDFGETWTNRSLPHGEILGRISYSSVNPNQLVYVSGSGNIYFSEDKGESWELSKNAPSNVIDLENVWNRNKILASDLVNGTFYILKNNEFYASLDGNSWELKGKFPFPDVKDRFHNVMPAPERPGEVWLSMGTDGLWKTEDGGISFIRMEDFDNARVMCWGASAPGSELPTAYVFGTINSIWGMYRSVDMGKNWVRINDDKNQFPAGVAAIDADKNRFGRIYVGSGGYGISYGEPVGKKQ